MRTSTLLRRLTIGLGSLVVLLVVVAIGFIWFGPVAISDKSVLLNMLLDRGVTAPNTEVIKKQLRVPNGFFVDVFADGLSGARMLRTTAEGDLIVSIPR